MPGYDDEIVNFAIEKEIPIVPGCVTAADIQKGYKKGLRVFKFFPAEQCGGLTALKLLSGPFKGIKFLPTGGMNYDNIGTYLKEKYILACGGSYMADSALLAAKDFDAITQNCRRAIRLSLGFELAHVGIKHEGEQEAFGTVQTLCRLFGLEERPLRSAVFAGTAVEAVKKKGYGTRGHVGFYTNSIRRALAHFEELGVAINEESIQRDAANNMTCVYLRDEIAGFAFHIVSR